MTVFKILVEFFKTLPTATILYLLLVLFTEVSFSWFWLILAVILDFIDEILGRAI